MISVKDEGILLSVTNLPFESMAVMNPACIERDGFLHMFYRAVAPGNYSSIGHCMFKDHQLVKRWPVPALVPEFEYEKHGVEDPRIVLLDGVYYLFYVAYDGQNALTAYATSTDLMIWKKQGLVSPLLTYDMVKNYFELLPMHGRYVELNESHIDAAGGGQLLWQKDAFIFPKKINGSFVMLYRILPGIQVISFHSFAELNELYWQQYFRNFGTSILLDPVFPFESRYIGGCSPPIETPDGWLLINQGVEQRGMSVVYHATAALLDLQTLQVTARLPYPLFSPHNLWEMQGTALHVVFPSSALVRQGRLYIYYGAADKCIAAKSVDLAALLEELKRNPVIK